MAAYNLNALLQGGMDLAKAFGQQSPDDYITTQTKLGQRDIAVGKARALADQAAARHGYEMTLINAGIPAAQAKIMAASGAAGYNPDQMADFLGKTQAQRFRDSIVERATAGDIPGAGAYSLGLATGPLEMTKITDGTAYNPYLQANQQVSTTPVGQSTINQRNAAAGASNASAASHYATAAKTRSDMNIGQEKFGLEKSGQWNPSGKTPAAGGLANKPIPTAALKNLLDVEDALGGAQNVNDVIQKHSQRIANGQLKIGPVDSIGMRFRSGIGKTSANDRNLKEWDADMTKLVNESLRLNKGVQTEGDAQRAVKELVDATDNATATAALKRLSGYNKQAVELQKRKRQIINENYGRTTPSDNNAASEFGGSGIESLIGKYGAE